MKVLSIKEPFATLIKDKEKYIETRSWKTTYRGELYIHASLSKYKNESMDSSYIDSLIKDKTLNYGYIICKCKLVDCIKIDKSFQEKISKDEKEYKLGDYTEGRYAWILEDIEELHVPIKAKGKLNIWEYTE